MGDFLVIGKRELLIVVYMKLSFVHVFESRPQNDVRFLNTNAVVQYTCGTISETLFNDTKMLTWPVEGQGSDLIRRQMNS